MFLVCDTNEITKEGIGGEQIWEGREGRGGAEVKKRSAREPSIDSTLSLARHETGALQNMATGNLQIRGGWGGGAVLVPSLVVKLFVSLDGDARNTANDWLRETEAKSTWIYVKKAYGARVIVGRFDLVVAARAWYRWII